MKAGLCIAALLISTAAFAQPASAPGPYIIDLRGAMSGAPSGTAFYPPVPANTLAPQRAFGFDVGAHVYPFALGLARVGLGVDLMRARGTATSISNINAAMTVTTLAPQLSFNFGTHEGWSYLSGGYGTTQTRAEVMTPAADATTAATLSRERRTRTINIGGGARWFVRERMAVGFDVRFHRLAATLGLPSKQIVGLSVGVSIR
jgi:outer membrane protein with beta-barrel domain